MENTTIVCSLVILSVLSIWVNSFCIYILNVGRSLYRTKPASIYVLNLFVTHLFQACVVLPSYTGKKIEPVNQTWAYVIYNHFLLGVDYYSSCAENSVFICKLKMLHFSWFQQRYIGEYLQSE